MDIKSTEKHRILPDLKFIETIKMWLEVYILFKYDVCFSSDADCEVQLKALKRVLCGCLIDKM